MTDTLDEIMALIRQRETALQGELEKLKDFRSAFDVSRLAHTTAAVPAPYERSTADESSSTVIMGNTRKLNDAQRKRISRRMKRYWRERNSKK